MTTRTKVFVSYSHADKDIRDEVLRSLRAVPRIKEVLWWDEDEIAIGNKLALITAPATFGHSE